MKKQTGFTIIELLMTVAIAGAMVAIALPNYQNHVRNNCLTTSVNTMVTTLQLARSESTKRRASVSVLASNAANTSNEWGLGWTVFQDADADGVVDGTEDVIRVVELTCENTTIDETAHDSIFIYRPTGFIDDTGTFNVCDDRTGEKGRQLSISITGRPNINSEFTCS